MTALPEAPPPQPDLARQLQIAQDHIAYLLDTVIPIGVALALEENFNRLLERILQSAQSLCHADGGTLYLRTADDHLKFVIMRTASLGRALGGATEHAIPYPPLPLYDAEGRPNHHNVATYTALTGITTNIPDAYAAAGFDFSGTKAFDAQTGYRSTSFLTIPLQNGRGQVVGVLQLLNAQDSKTGRIIPFDSGLQRLVEALCSLAVVALEAYLREERLRQEVQQLRIEIDEVKAERQAAEVMETDYFETLQRKVNQLRARSSD